MEMWVFWVTVSFSFCGGLLLLIFPKAIKEVGAAFSPLPPQRRLWRNVSVSRVRGTGVVWVLVSLALATALLRAPALFHPTKEATEAKL